MNINENYTKLEESYLFSTVAKKVSEFAEKNPDKKIISLGIGDVTRPIVPEVIKAITDLAHNHSEKMALYPDPDSVLLREAIASMLNTTGGLLWQDATSAETAECSSAWETVAGKNAALQSPALRAGTTASTGTAGITSASARRPTAA